MMEKTDIASKVLKSLYSVVPEAEEEELQENLTLREQFDMDSMDFLNFIIKLHQDFAIDIPESDYGKLTTLDKITAYITAR
jgi:acyl carrier protein